MNFWRRKTLANSCLFVSLFMSRDIVKTKMVKFGKPPMICQGFPLLKIHTIWYTSSNSNEWSSSLQSCSLLRSALSTTQISPSVLSK